MMLQAIAIAIARFLCFVFENLTKWFIRLFLEEFFLVGNPAELLTRDQLLARAGLVDERHHRMIEWATRAEDYIFID